MRRLVGTLDVVVVVVVGVVVVVLDVVVVVELDVTGAVADEVGAESVGSDAHAASSAITPSTGARRQRRRTALPTTDTLGRAWVAVRAGTPTGADRDP